MIPIVQIIIAFVTTGFGAWILLQPKVVIKFTGLKPLGPRGITEIRAAFGGLFLALGIATMVLNQYMFLGVIYITIGLVRFVSMILIDKSSQESSNWISLVTEFIFGIILLF